MKRVYLSLATVAAIAAVTTAGSFALFTSETRNANNTFATGTVSIGDITGTAINVTNLAPGDTGSAGGLSVTYTGSIEAWIGVKATPSGDLFAGATPLSVTVTADGENVALDSAWHALTNQYTNGANVPIGVDYEMPLAADNSYQGKTGEVHLEVKAVQARNNPSKAGF